MPAEGNSVVLSSWKEIAAYLGKGVRTVQRWERELNLPVRRPIAHNQRIVIAVPEELDQWIHRQLPRAAAPKRKDAVDARLQDLHTLSTTLVANAKQLEQSAQQLIATARRRTRDKIG